MEMPKQMGAGSADQVRQRHQGADTDSEARREPQPQQLAETPAEQMRPLHFSDWASI
jgi:hypothetical protein